MTAFARLRALAPSALRPAVMVAPLVTLGVVGAGIAVAGSTGTDEDRLAAISTAQVRADVSARTEEEGFKARSASRSFERTSIIAVSSVGDQHLRLIDTRYATEDLDLRVAPRPAARVVGTVDQRDKVQVTGQQHDGFAEVKHQGKFLWVTAEYLSEKRPKADAIEDPAAAGLSMDPCPSSAVESGLTAAAVRVHRAVCNNFPQISTYGGRDGHGEHVNGKAIDIMTSDVRLGTAIAEYLRAHASELGIYNVIWRQRIWTQERGGEGWRFMPSRGSATANHYDHVHVSVY